MSISDIEQQLRETDRTISVKDSDDIPFSDYHEFIDLEKTGKLRIASTYDRNLVYSLGGKAEAIMHTLLVWSPALFAIASVFFAFIPSKMLFGVPLAFLGFLLSTPVFMKSIGSLIALGHYFILVTLVIQVVMVMLY